MRILITGSNGFIGKNMVEWMSQEEWVIDQWQYDLNNLPDIKRYNWVIHLGAITDNSVDIDTILKQNLDFSQWLFNECNLHKVHMQYASSAEVYGYNNDFSEYAPCHPITTVAWSKYLFDRWVFNQEHSCYVHGFRYFNVYGKYMHTKKNNADIMCLWRNQAINNKEIILPENAIHIKRDWVWIGDVCRLHIDFIKNIRGSGIWNVGTGLAHNYLDIAEEIANQEGAEIKFSTPSNEPLIMKSNTKLLKSTIGKRQWLNVYEWIDRGLE